jgi:iron complex transport system substrate-binding protein
MTPVKDWQPVYVVLLSLLLSACAPFPNQAPASRDPNDSPAASNSDQRRAERVVVLSSLAADILYQLDPSKLAGVPDSRLFNQQPGLQTIPTVSQGCTPPNLEKIVALKPDLVVGTVGFHDRTLADLQRLSIPTLRV